MSREILMATRNPHKAERFKHYFTKLGLSVLSFADLGTEVSIVEDGKTPEENALKKAKAGFEATEMPAFGVDYWFFIDGLPNEMQPGPFVRRIVSKGGERVEATDEEMLEYYTNMVDVLGGETKGHWVSAIALVLKNYRSYTARFTRDTILTSNSSPRRTPGEPLNSIQIDPASGKYFTDLTPEDWLRLQAERERGYIELVREHIHEI